MIRAHELLQFRNFLGGEIIITFGMAILRVLPWNTADIERREEICRWGSQCTRRGRAGEVGGGGGEAATVYELKTIFQ